MKPDELAKLTNKDLSAGLISAYNLMARLPYVTPDVRKRGFYLDPRHYPSYFYLGRRLEVENILCMTLGGGLSLGSFLLGNQTAKRILGFEKKADSFYSPRMAEHNIRCAYHKNFESYVGSPFDEKFQQKLASAKWDLVFFDREMEYDDHLAYLRMVWAYIPQDGWLIVDRIYYHKPSGRAFHDFCRTYNKDYPVIKSKYGMGVICK